MLRYICPVVLAGGSSSRFGINKVFFSFNNIKFLDLRINFLFDFGFLDIYISGNFNGYSIIIDECFKKGPLLGVYTTYLHFFDKYFSHFLFFPVDLNFFCKKSIFFLFLISSFFYSYFYNFYIFPFLLAFSLNVLYVLFCFCLSLNFNILSLYLFFNFVLVEKFYVNKFCFKYFLNLNIYYNLFLII